MLSVDRRDDVALVRMVRGKGNALNLEFLRAWIAQLETLEEDAAVKAVIVTGQGSVFSAGVDLVTLLNSNEGYLDDFLPTLDTFFQRLATFSKPVVAAINGHALAGGGIIALACDQRLMARGGGRIGLTELQVGVPFPTWPLEIARFATPPEHFQTLVGTGRTWLGEAALERGLIDELVEADQLEPRAWEVARELAAISAATFRLTKQQVRRPLVEAVARRAAVDNPLVWAIWKSAEVRQTMQQFVARNVGKK